ncbi:site-specific integrase [Myroides marinus]|uniref:site-specific integrase n=1 Tax=Myroides TaxID=76831 RepID=UPI00103C5FE7|nr:MULTISPECIES: site-specific integrase [Myroides]MDM1352571.1 site-specific integrase [Myroides marinus]MDM1356140.1 site-specific integrase [Myroides marinus]MDM1359779.1 site-specific integrase [Myroides marinus]MDM1366858.1 site-specific integrase [Myroides marinus]MDM1370310.1 site-specific integrase [Myroides marinus]
MATIRFFLQSKKENAQIHVRVSVSRGVVVRKSTGFVINAQQWSEKTNLPKQTNAESKTLRNSLNKLQTHLYEVLNDDLAKGVLIDGNWLENQINTCFNRIDKSDTNVFVNYIQYMIDNASTKETRGGKIGLSEGTIKNYRSFKKIIEEFEKYSKVKILFKDINKSFTEKFKTWLLKTKKYTVNYSGKQFEFIKTVCLDAQKNDINVTIHSTTLQPFRQQDKDRFIHTLSFDELLQIYNTQMPTKHLKTVQKWILIGCYVGQRGGDLLSITPENIRENAKGVYIDVLQQKTGKNVTIGVIQDFVLSILKNDFPEPVSLNKINFHISKVCEIAKINEVVEGYITNSETKQKELVSLPKYNFITSHSFRRSFATNFYKKMPTPIIMGITGHTQENIFLKYINQRQDKDANADLFMTFFEKMNSNVEPQLKVVKKIV